MLPDEFLKRVRAIEVAARKLVKQGMGGQYLSAFRGSGMQFREFRDYVYGDDVRHISWNVTARTERPVLKTFEEERERTLFLLVDVSASLRRGPWAVAKADRLAEVAAILALSAAEAQDKFGMLLFSDRVEKVIPPAKGKTHMLRMIRDVLAFEPSGTHTSPDIALRQLDHILKKQSIVFLLSDLEVLPSEEALRRVLRKHEFVSITVEHATEWSLPPFGFLELQTAEAGRPVTVDTISDELRRYLLQHGQTRRQVIQDLFKRSGVDLLWLMTNQDFVPALQDFFAKRKRR